MVAAGPNYTLLVQPDGTVTGWGFNSSGQLAMGTTVSVGRPTRSTLTGIIGVVTGQMHTLLLAHDATVLAAGSNSYGQLGDGSTTLRTSAVPVAGLTSVSAIATGATHSLALRADGTVWAWGYNASGQLGDGTTTNRTSPVQVSGLSNVIAIAAGGSHSLAVRDDGTVWAWGVNSSRQLADPSAAMRLTPVQVPGLTTATAVAAGAAHSLARLQDGTLVAWGNNTYGQLGEGTLTLRAAPTPVTGLSAVATVHAGAYTSAAIGDDGRIHTWGDGQQGQLASGAVTSRSVPGIVGGVADVAHLAIGTQHAIAVSEDGTVYAWGTASGYGELGDGSPSTVRLTAVDVSAPSYAWRVATPSPSVAPSTYTVPPSIAVSSATPGAAIRYTTDGSIPTTASPAYAGPIVPTATTTLSARAFLLDTPDSLLWQGTYVLRVATPAVAPWGGAFSSPQTVTLSTSTPGATIRYTLDGSTPNANSPQYTGPLTIDQPRMLRTVAEKAGWAVSAEQSASFTFNYGTLATPTASLTSGTHVGTQTVSLSGPASAEVRYTTTGADPTATSPLYTAPFPAAVSGTLKVKAFRPGYTPSTTLTVPFLIQVPAPTLSVPAGTYAPGTVTQVAAEATATARVTIDGRIPTSSDEAIASGALLTIGRYTVSLRAFKSGCEPSTTTVVAYDLSADLTAPKVAAGQGHAVVVQSDGTVQAWGANGNGQLAIGSTTSSLGPRATTLTGIVAVAAGQTHSVFLHQDATVWTAGANAAGQLGDGTTTQRLSAVPVSGLTSVAAIAAGTTHTLALRADGTVWAWGSNASGQLGDGTTTPRTLPVAVIGLPQVIAIAAGGSHSLAVGADGSVWAWGANGSRQLGDPAVATRSTPAAVSGLTTAVTVAAGVTHSLAVLADGTVRAWGSNSAGELGDGTTVQRTAPVVVVGLAGVSAVYAGSSSSAARVSDGTLLTWGSNVQGQLGSGSTANRSVPGPVPGLPAIERAGVGERAMLAIASDRRLFVWGYNGSGELGDGTYAVRTAPLEIAAPGLAWRAPVPTFSVAPGVFSTPPSIALASALMGGSVRYTVDGTDPTETSTAYAAPIVPTGSVTLRARTYSAAQPPSSTLAATYTLQVVTPTLTPSGGTFGSPQNVSGSTPTAGATLRFTTDGTDPTASSPVLGSPQVIDGTTTLRVSGFKDGWEASTPRLGTFTFTYPSLAAPTLSLASGLYVGDQTITIAGPPGAELRYTLNGSEPSETSLLYLSTISVTTSSTLKAKAFRSGYSPSPTTVATLQIRVPTPSLTLAPGTYPPGAAVAVTTVAGATVRYTQDGSLPTTSSATLAEGASLPVGNFTLVVRSFKPDCEPSETAQAAYEVSTGDAIPPTISALIYPKPNAAGWNNTPVRIRYFCDDLVALASCPQETVIDHEGESTVQAFASDAAGNEATVTSTVKIDMTPPTLERPQSESALAVDAEEVSVSVAASDPLSGLQGVTCNGAPAPLSEAISCTVQLQPGLNVAIIAAMDLAGNSSSLSQAIRRTVPVGSVSLGTTGLTLAVGQQAAIVARDNNGTFRPSADAVWSTSNSSVAVMNSEVGAVDAVGVGTARLEAIFEDSLTAYLDVEVVAPAYDSAGFPRLPQGTVRSVTPLSPGDQVVPADSQSPGATDFYAYDTEASRDVLRRYSVAAGVLEPISLPVFSTAWNADWMIGDVYGGIVLGEQFDQSTYSAKIRRIGEDGEDSWQHKTTYGHVFIGAPAQTLDGKIYAVEWDHDGATISTSPGWLEEQQVWLTALDGTSGHVVGRFELPRVKFCAMPHRCTVEPWISGSPVVTPDGNVHVIATTGSHVVDYSTAEADWIVVSSSITSVLVSVTPTGVISQRALLSGSSSYNWRRAPEEWPSDLIPVGAALTARSADRLALWNLTGQNVVPIALPQGVSSIDRAIGTDARLIISDEGTEPVTAALDLSGALLWTHAGSVLGAGLHGTTIVEDANGSTTLLGPTGQWLTEGQAGSVFWKRDWWLKEENGWWVVAAGLSASASGFDVDQGDKHAQRSAQQKNCWTCVKDFQKPPGFGVVSSTDSRRVVTVFVDPSWDDSPGVTNTNAWNAVTCAVDMWNAARAPDGRPGPVYFEIDQLQARGTPDITVWRTTRPDQLCGVSGAIACTESSWRTFGAGYTKPNRVWLWSVLADTQRFSSQQFCGTMAHELMHRLGAHSFESSPSCGPSILQQYRTSQQVTPIDVDVANDIWTYPGQCTAVEGRTRSSDQLSVP